MLHYYLAATNPLEDRYCLMIQDQADSQKAIAVKLVRLGVQVITDTKLIGTDLQEYAISLVLCLSDYVVLTTACKASQLRYCLLSQGAQISVLTRFAFTACVSISVLLLQLAN